MRYGGGVERQKHVKFRAERPALLARRRGEVLLGKRCKRFRSSLFLEAEQSCVKEGGFREETLVSKFQWPLVGFCCVGTERT